MNLNISQQNARPMVCLHWRIFVAMRMVCILSILHLRSQVYHSLFHGTISRRMNMQ